MFENPDADLKTFLKSAFRHFHVKYPKFFKMDEISKLGFITAEVLLQEKQNENFNEEEIGIVLSNSQSTLVTDTLHQQSVNHLDNFYPSPSVFVYTLPNIMIGEISIRHKLRGDNAFFIFERFNANYIVNHINQQMNMNHIKACIGGWVDQSADNYEAFLYWVGLADHQKIGTLHTEEEVRKLYDKI